MAKSSHLIEWLVPNLELKIFHYIYLNKIALGLLVTMSSKQNGNTGKKGHTSEKRKAYTTASPSSQATKQL